MKNYFPVKIQRSIFKFYRRRARRRFFLWSISERAFENGSSKSLVTRSQLVVKGEIQFLIIPNYLFYR